VSAYRHPDRRAGKTELTAVIKTISHGVPSGLPELSRLGRALKQRAADVLAYFDRPGTSNGPTEAINGRLEHIRGTALGSASGAPGHHWPGPAAQGLRLFSDGRIRHRYQGSRHQVQSSWLVQLDGEPRHDPVVRQLRRSLAGNRFPASVKHA